MDHQTKRDYFEFFQDTTAHSRWWNDPILLFAVITAIIIHVSIISIHFVSGSSSPVATKDVSIAVQLTNEKIKDSDFLAQQNQKGDGVLKKKFSQSTPVPLTAPDSTMGEKEQEMLEQLSQKKQRDFQERMLMTTLSWQKQSQNEERKKTVDQLESQMQSRAAMIASIEAQFSQRQQIYTKKQKVKTVTGIQAKKDASSAYLDKFRQKVEMFGNRYYPEEAKQQRLSGDVRLMVILNSQGEIRAIRLLESSGHPILDEAAKASVRRAMPFGQFDNDMKEISELHIVRTWRFDAKDSVFDVQ